MKELYAVRVPKKVLASTIAAGLIAMTGSVSAAQTYTITNVLVPPDQYSGEADTQAAPVWKPHETKSSAPRSYWISSNERGAEAGAPGQTQQFDNMAGITIFDSVTNAVLSTLNIEEACIPVVLPDGTLMKQFGGCAPPGAEGHPRHPHGIDIDDARKIAWQVIEHSGLQWNATRTAFKKANTTDAESGLLVAYDISDLHNPKILRGYVTGHATEEDTVVPGNHKVYAGNHEPAPGVNVGCWVSVIDESTPTHPYKFIDMAANQCVQGVWSDPALHTVNGTTHFGETMWTFNSDTDTIMYSVNLRKPFDDFIATLPPAQQFTIPTGWILHFHDLTTDRVNHRAYNGLHTIASVEEIAGVDEEAEIEGPEITGRWIAEVNTDPASPDFKKVHIIDLSNGQSVPAVPDHHDAVATGLPFDKLFVHVHFMDIDPSRNALIATGEHTGNMAAIDVPANWNAPRTVSQVLSISRLIPNCTPDELEPHLHGANVQQGSTGTVYLADEGEHCFYESVTILKPN
jgi:hypothetical protein